MKKLTFLATLLLLLTCFSFNSSYSQWETGKSYFGPTIGLSFLGSAPQIGLNYEYAYTMKDFGVIGIGGILRYWSYSDDWAWGTYTYTNIIIGAQANYHFKMDNKTFDPFAGLVLGYNISSSKWEDKSGWFGSFVQSSASAGGLILNAQGGIRYFMNDKLALVARLGYGSLSYGSLDIGVDFKF